MHDSVIYIVVFLPCFFLASLLFATFKTRGEYFLEKRLFEKGKRAKAKIIHVFDLANPNPDILDDFGLRDSSKHKNGQKFICYLYSAHISGGKILHFKTNFKLPPLAYNLFKEPSEGNDIEIYYLEDNPSLSTPCVLAENYGRRLLPVMICGTMFAFNLGMLVHLTWEGIPVEYTKDWLSVFISSMTFLGLLFLAAILGAVFYYNFHYLSKYIRNWQLNKNGVKTNASVLKKYWVGDDFRVEYTHPAISPFKQEAIITKEYYYEIGDSIPVVHHPHNVYISDVANNPIHLQKLLITFLKSLIFISFYTITYLYTLLFDIGTFFR